MITETPILRLYREHQAIMAEADAFITDAAGEAEDQEMERLFWQRTDKIMDEIMNTPSTCAADFAAKVILDTCKGTLIADWETDELWKEARALVGEGATTPGTPVQVLFAEWQKLQARYDELDREWAAGKLTNVEFEDQSDPILAVKDAVEDKIMASECKNGADIRALVTIADHFDWACPDYNQAVMREATRRAGELAA